MSEPPVPPKGPPVGPRPDGSAPIADMREKFARESGRTPRDPEAERAFLQNKIDMIRTHPAMSPAEKEEAVAPLLRELREWDDETGRGPR